MTEGLKKKNIQRTIQKVHTGGSVSSVNLDATTTTDKIELGFPAEKISVVTTGNLIASVLPKIGTADANTAISASGLVTTTITSNLFSSLEITRLTGAGKVIILVK